jgi:hypothetical protein
MASGAAEQLGHVGESEDPEREQPLVEHPLDVAVREVAGHVEVGSGWGGDGETLVEPDIRSGERSAPVHDYPVWSRTPAPVVDRHVNRARRARAKPPKRRRAVMAQDGPLPAGEERGGLGGEREVSGVGKPVDAAVDELELPVAEAAFDCGWLNPGTQELWPACSATLGIGNEMDQRLVRCAGTAPYSPTIDQSHGARH